MIELKGVHRSYGNFLAVQNLSFSVSSSTGITALLGPNGAGKSTTMKLMTGYLSTSEGEIRINGLSPSNPDEILPLKKQIGYLPETSPLYPEMFVSEYLEFIGRIHGLTGDRLGKRFRNMVDALELSSHLYSPISILSRGYRQRVALAGALIHDPDIIILDEPTSGLDPNQITHIRGIIRDLGKSKTVILSTHILQEVEDVCENVLIIHRGVLVANDRKSNLTNVRSCLIEARGKDILTTLRSIPLVSSVEESDSVHGDFKRYTCSMREDQPEKLFASVADRGWEIREFRPLSRSMQEIFRELTA